MKNIFKLIMTQEKMLSPNDALSEMLHDALGDDMLDDDLTDEQLEFAIGAAKRNDVPPKPDFLK